MRRLLNGRSGSGTSHNNNNPIRHSNSSSSNQADNEADIDADTDLMNRVGTERNEDNDIADTNRQTNPPLPTEIENRTTATTATTTTTTRTRLPIGPIDTDISIERIEVRESNEHDEEDDTIDHNVDTTFNIPPQMSPLQLQRGVDQPATIATTEEVYRSDGIVTIPNTEESKSDSVVINRSTSDSSLRTSNNTNVTTSNHTHSDNEVPQITRMTHAISNGIESATSNRSNRTFSSVSSGGSENHNNTAWRQRLSPGSNHSTPNTTPGRGMVGVASTTDVNDRSSKYPTVFEDSVQDPPIDYLVATKQTRTKPKGSNSNSSSAGNSSDKHRLSQLSSLSSKESTTNAITSSKRVPEERATKPGAVSVRNSIVPLQQQFSKVAAYDKMDLERGRRVELEKDQMNDYGLLPPTSFASLPTPSLSLHISQGSLSAQGKISLSSDNSFWEKKLPSTITTVRDSTNNSNINNNLQRQSSLQLDMLHTETKEFAPKRYSQSLIVTHQDLGDGTQPYPHLVNNIEQTNNAWHRPTLQNTTDNTYGMPSNDSNVPTSFEPVMWGKKPSKKSSLEDDIHPDGLEVAFVENINTSHPIQQQQQQPSNRHEEDSLERLSYDDDKDFQAVLTASKLEAAALASKQEDQDDSQYLKALEASQSTNVDVVNNTSSMVRMSKQAIEYAKENADSARNMMNQGNVDLDYLQTILDLCREDQRIVAQAVEDAISHDVIDADLEVLIDLNNNILDVLETGDRVIGEATRNNDNSVRLIPASMRTNNLDVKELVEAFDIFSLICMLRVQTNEKRLDAAYALMKFSRDAEQNQDIQSIMLRDEIRSSGGLDSLLTLFGVRDTSYDLKAITALAVAYLVPALVESSSETPPSVGLRVVECLKFLSTANPLLYNEAFLSDDEMKNASIEALASLWVVRV
jgi:hypothetical protein